LSDALLAVMQLQQSFMSGDRPKCCPHCNHSTVHRHAKYSRYSKADGCSDEDLQTIERYFCPLCGRTCSVLPDDMLPYRSISASKTQKHFDAVFNGGPAPPVTEKERGCLQRACKRFIERVTPLTNVLGQMIRVIRPTAQKLWQALRTFGNLAEILCFLARDFKTSLLGDYRCLIPCS
jgi:transposase-like protein